MLNEGELIILYITVIVKGNALDNVVPEREANGLFTSGSSLTVHLIFPGFMCS